MRIDFLQISNILSFPFFADVGSAEKISFDKGLNILIGENGSGKSTALEAINFIFRKVLFRQARFNRELFNRRLNLTGAQQTQILGLQQQANLASFRLNANWDTEGDEQKIRLRIILDEIDKENIRNITKNKEKILSALRIFSSYEIIIDNKISTEYTIDLTLNRATNDFILRFVEGERDFGFCYLADYHVIREIINIHNHIMNSAEIDPLQESFTLISSFRNYHSFQPAISLSHAPVSQQLQEIRDQDYNKSLNASDSGEPPVFAIVRLRVAEHHFDLTSAAKNDAQCETEANEIPLIVSINNRLRGLSLECRIKLVDKRTWQYAFEFFDTRRGQPIGDINSLSAGQKAIVHLVLEAYGRGELKGGVVIIDEPEIHLHYQLQHEYMQVLRDINNTQSCQYIIVTHSESLIDSNTISSVRRFSISNGKTSVFSPELSADQKSLIRILDNSRSTYAFFAKKVVLVEGDTDRYFIRALIRERHRLQEQEIAVLNVGGKSELPKWRSLFTSFGLRVFAISDFDNIINLRYRSDRGKKLTTQDEVIAFKNLHPDWHLNIVDLMKEGMFVLQEGDLEAYLNVRKDLADVITFCQNNLQAFLQDDASSKSIEIRNIIDTIAA